MGTSLVYSRSTLSAPKSRQQVRLTAQVAAPAPSGGWWNCVGPNGDYYQTWAQSNNVWVAWAPDGAVALAYSNQVITGNASEPHIAVDPRGRCVLAYTRNVSGTLDVLTANSYDDGQTFDTPTVAISGGKHAFCACGQNGTLIVAAYVSTNIQYELFEPGDTSPSVTGTFKDSTGTNLVVSDDQFCLSQGQSNDAPWVLLVTISGETATSRWLSFDDGATFQRVT